MEGGKDAATTTAEAFDQKVAWIREAAGERLEEIELHVLALGAMITDERRKGAEAVIAEFASFPPGVVQNPVSDVDVLLASPQMLVGTVEHVCADLRERRERYGISYITIPPESVEAFAPVVERLAGT